MDRLARLYGWLDARLDLDRDRELLGKAFPAEDSFLLGEIAVFCFLVLVLTGLFLGMFYEPSVSKVEYEGSVERYQGQKMSEAYVSVLQITYDVPYGMFIRRMHHWAAHLFIASIGLHMLRVFFTGAYRNPREPNWVIGTVLAVLAMGAAYTGYALPFDEFAATATGIGYNVVKSIPLLGNAFAKIVFGGDFPSSATIPRLYFLHVLVIPVAIGLGLAAHLAILIRQKHTEASRDGDVEGGGATIDADDDSMIVGLPAVPNQAAVSAVVFFLTLATLSLLAGFLPVHNVAAYGPRDPASTPDLIMPDWFLMWGYGFLKTVPGWLSFSLLGIHVTTEFVGGVFLPSLVILGVLAWPFVDDHDEPIHFTADPLERPRATAVGVAAVTMVMIASIAGMNSLLARVLGVPTGVINPILQVALLVGPIVYGGITYAVLGGSESDTTGDAGAESPAGAGPDEPAADGDPTTGDDTGEGTDD